jgi:hypothetical protein
MAGYYGYSMSNNAVRARNDGKLPMTEAKRELAKAFGITQKRAREILEEVGHCEWHHTSKKYNITYFYDVEGIIHAQEVWNTLSGVAGDDWQDKVQAERVKTAWDFRADDCKAYLEKYPGYSLVVLGNEKEALRRVFGDAAIARDWICAENYLGV